MSTNNQKAGMPSIRVLLLEDRAEDADLIMAALAEGRGDSSALCVETRAAFSHALDEFRPDIVLCDFSLPDFDGRQALDMVRERCPATPVIIVSGAIGDERAAELIKAGACDYVLKDRLARLPFAVKRALAEAEEIRQHEAAELRRHTSEEAIRAVVENSPDVIVRYDRQCRRIYVNPAMETLLGHSAAEVIGTRPDAFSAHPSPLRLIAQLRQVFETGAGITEETPARNAQGEMSWGQIRLVPEFGSDGQVATVLLIGRNIHELKEREQSMRWLAENSPDVIVRYDRGGRRTYVNREFERVNGLSAQEVLGKTPFEISTELGTMTPVFVEKLMAAMEAGVPTTIELEREWQGRREWWFVRVVPEHDADGKVVSAITVWSDISERKTTEVALRASEQEFRSLAENSPDIIMRWGLDCRCSYVNAAFERETEIPASAALGLEVSAQQLGYISISDYRVQARRVMETGEPAELVLSYSRPSDGGVVRLALRIVPEYSPEGRIRGVLGIGRNITALLEAERQLDELGSQLRALAARRETVREEERRHIARELHDELGQQLSALRFGLNLLDFQFGDKQPSIRDATARLLGLVDKTIQVTRDVSSALRPAVLDMGIVPALEWLTAEFSRQTGIPCDLTVPQGDLDMCEEQGIVIFRIAQESLTNAARHSKAELVQVVLECEQACFVLEVKDNGVGFDAIGQHKEKSFGLVGIRERALAVGGDVAVSSVPGGGTVVRVRIPVLADKGRES